jgi:hypothetical protein
MSEKTNDEKLRILQERLTHIKQKKDIPSALKKQQKEVVPDAQDLKKSSFNLAKEAPIVKSETPQKEKTPMSFGWLKYVVIIGSLGYGGFYAYENSNVLTSEKTDTKEVNIAEIKYTLNFEGQNHIAITETFEDESSAKAMVNDLKVKGFQADYFYLPNKSNSTEKVYQVFIGPYENEEETKQWTKNLQIDFKIISL